MLAQALAGNILGEATTLIGNIPTEAMRTQRRAQLPDNVGRAWTTEEEGDLVSAFKSGDSPTTIARQHGRTLRAIEARLEKLGLITAEQRTTRGGFTGTN